MPTQLDYQTARALALETLLTLDIEACCNRAGLSLEVVSRGIRCVLIPYLGSRYRLMVQSDSMFFDDAGGGLKIPDQVLLLHYLITADGTPVGEEWITFREVPSGSFYYAAFEKRAIRPLLKCFGQDPSVLHQVSQVIGQVLSSPGDTALRVLALPRVPVVLSLWRGDDEFPPQGNLFLDQSVISYLPTEDIAYLCGAVVYKVIGTIRQLLGNRPG